MEYLNAITISIVAFTVVFGGVASLIKAHEHKTRRAVSSRLSNLS